ncbi:MAG: hypothetical protein ACI4I6_03560 [Hominimerdicola sp.]
MLLIFPKKYEFETSLPPKRVYRKLDGELTEHKPTINIMSTGKFMKNHKTESVYYGRREGDEFQIFYHKAGKRDGGETGFFGRIEKTAYGSKITGKYRKPLSTYIFGIIWAVFTAFSALMSLALKENVGAIVCAVLLIAGIFLLFWDGKVKFLKAYLDSFPDKNV